jgi:hypothetical protein
MSEIAMGMYTSTVRPERWLIWLCCMVLSRVNQCPFAPCTKRNMIWASFFDHCKRHFGIQTVRAPAQAYHTDFDDIDDEQKSRNVARPAIPPPVPPQHNVQAVVRRTEVVIQLRQTFLPNIGHYIRLSQEALQEAERVRQLVRSGAQQVHFLGQAPHALPTIERHRLCLARAMLADHMRNQFGEDVSSLFQAASLDDIRKNQAWSVAYGQAGLLLSRALSGDQDARREISRLMNAYLVLDDILVRANEAHSRDPDRDFGLAPAEEEDTDARTLALSPILLAGDLEDERATNAGEGPSSTST